MKRNKPLFWKHIKKNMKQKIDKDIVCPMNMVIDVLNDNIKKYKLDNKCEDITDYVVKVKGKAKKEQMDKIIAIVKGLSDFDINNSINENKDYLTMNMLTEEAIDKIAKMSMNKKTVNRLITRALLDKVEGYCASKYRRKLLNVLYNSNNKRFIDNFIKGEQLLIIYSYLVVICYYLHMFT